MERGDLVLMVLAAGEGAPHTPVQVQKLLFLVDRRLGPRISGPYFDFKPYFYGPFDREVYVELETLAGRRLLEICSEGTRRSYRLTSDGQQKGDRLLSELAPEMAPYLRSLSSAVRRLRFGELVSAIYRAYPEMRVNSVFQSSE
jgi:uncharacterized protein YwgA